MKEEKDEQQSETKAESTAAESTAVAAKESAGSKPGIKAKKEETAETAALVAEEVNNEELVGYWKCIRLTEKDEKIEREELEKLYAEGSLVYLHLENGGKGEFVIYGSSIDIVWNDKEINSSESGSEAIAYTLKGKELTLRSGDTEMVFEKTDEDLSKAAKVTETPAPTPTSTPTPTATPIPTHVHAPQFVARVEPTCTSAGTEAYYVCSGCGKTLDSNQNEIEITFIPPTGHNMVDNGGYPPSCTYEGRKVSICTICGEEQSESLPIPSDLSLKGYHSISYTPQPGAESIYHIEVCWDCGMYFYDNQGIHTSSDPCSICGFSGPKG
ncbi:MAG: hypothetical protein Q4B22_01240 [Eubacteriales bacterium]|nr:hypothetical protein [Eubacteriales bacterium]